MSASAFAPAKVNLFLHVGRPGADGMHPLCSLMVFADVGDTVRLDPAPELSFAVTGPFAGPAGAGDDNLVLRAARALAEATGRLAAGRLTLDKQLPVAAGLGGGSSDAGAALRLIAPTLGLADDDALLTEVATRMGADGAACLHGRPVLAEGRGEVLSPAPGLPDLHAVLVNPGVPSSTPAVYRAYDAHGPTGDCARPDLPASFASARDVAQAMSLLRNDLETPAIALAPAIGEALQLLKHQPETLLARVSGSGATCFGLCDDAAEAERLASRLTDQRPGWWVRACKLGGPWG